MILTRAVRKVRLGLKMHSDAQARTLQELDM